ncbi:MAG: glycosyltransferase family 2 protein [Lachnospiraceae bacterium]|nr:glycosyltransferase family 2 protein [Lachnospiraceae bacterium]
MGAEMSKVAVCVLNYLNYKETMACVDSVLVQKGCLYQVVVVDNGSDNESYEFLKKRYSRRSNIAVIHVHKNYGFAKGHNIGIYYAKKHFNAEYVLLLNSDTVLPREDYLITMLQADEQGIGVIGSQIIMRNGKHQPKLEGYIVFPATMFYYMALFTYCYGFIGISNYFNQILKKYPRAELLHGSAFMLTPEYFAHYSGLYDKTFLYAEEDLLYLRCCRCGLKLKYINSVSIIHKGGQSVRMFYGGGASIKDKYRLRSYKFVLLESFIDFIRLNAKNNILNL